MALQTSIYQARFCWVAIHHFIDMSTWSLNLQFIDHAHIKSIKKTNTYKIIMAQRCIVEKWRLLLNTIIISSYSYNSNDCFPLLPNETYQKYLSRYRFDIIAELLSYSSVIRIIKRMNNMKWNSVSFSQPIYLRSVISSILLVSWTELTVSIV